MMARREHFFLTFEPSRSISSPLPPKGQRNGDFSLSFAFRSQVIEVIVLRRRRGLGGFIPSFSYVIRAFPCIGTPFLLVTFPTNGGRVPEPGYYPA